MSVLDDTPGAVRGGGRVWPRGARMPRKPVRIAALATAAACAVAGLLVYGAHQAYPVTRVPELSGLTWVTSSQIEALTLLDGVSGQAVVNVPVGRSPGDRLSATQAGTTGVVLDEAAGQMVRVDGTTYQPTPVAQAPIVGGTPVELLAGTHVVYAVGPDQGSVSTYDAGTLRQAGKELSVGGSATGIDTVVDSSDRLWILDHATGRLSWTTGTTVEHSPLSFTPADSTLILADGEPAVVDSGAARASLIREDGSIASTIPLGGAVGGDDLYSGLQSQRALIVTDSAHGTFRVCVFKLGTCAAPLQASFAGDILGSAASVAGRIFVPDYTNGSVWVLDPTGATRAVHTRSLTAPGEFDLFNRHGLIFYNDPQGDQAGTIAPDGTATPITKYTTTAPTSPSHAATATNSVVTPPSSRPTSTISPVPTTGPGTSPRSTTAPKPAPTGTNSNPVSAPKPSAVSSPPTGSGPPGTSPSPTPTPTGSAGISCGQKVTRSIVLDADMHCSGDGLVIAADNVTIDLAKHTLSGTGSGVGITMAGPSGALNAPMVENGTISGFATGLKIGTSGVHDAAVSQVTFTNDAAGGAALDAESGPVDGMQIDEATFSQSSGHAVQIQTSVTGQLLITGSTFRGGDVYFVEAPNITPTFVVTNNQFDQSGIGLEDVENSRIEENHFTGGGGINDMCAHFGGDTFHDNTFDGSSFGIVDTSMADESIDDNHFFNNFAGVQLVSGDGDTANRITNNDFHNEGNAGIVVADSATTKTPVTVSGNTVENSGFTPRALNVPGPMPVGGISIYAPQGGIVVSDNKTTSNQGYGIWSQTGTASGNGNISKGDQNGCAPTSLCTYN